MNFCKKITALCMPWVLVACSTLPTSAPVEEVIKRPVPETPVKKPEIVPPPVIKQQEAPVDSAVKAPAAVISLLQRAQQQAQKGDNKSAASSFERAIRMAPRYPESYYLLGELRYQEGAYRQAASFAQKSLILGAEGGLRRQAQDLLNRANGH